MKYLRVNKNTNIALDRSDAAAWQKIQGGRIDVMLNILRERKTEPKQVSRLLVLGMGNGSEAQCMSARMPYTRIVGTDIADYRLDGKERSYEFLKSDGRFLPFADESFDMVYSYHTLEHIPDAPKAVSEILRVLVPGGLFYAGVPNRLRLLAYIRVADVSLRRRLQWNLNEWKDRLCFRWSNEKGAHAGYTGKQLLKMMKGFANASDVSCRYYHLMYPAKIRFIRFLEATKLALFLYPGVYCIGRK